MLKKSSAPINLVNRGLLYVGQDTLTTYMGGQEPVSEGRLLSMIGDAIQHRDWLIKHYNEAIDNMKKIAKEEGVL